MAGSSLPQNSCVALLHSRGFRFAQLRLHPFPQCPVNDTFVDILQVVAPLLDVGVRLFRQIIFRVLLLQFPVAYIDTTAPACRLRRAASPAPRYTPDPAASSAPSFLWCENAPPYRESGGAYCRGSARRHRKPATSPRKLSRAFSESSDTRQLVGLHLHKLHRLPPIFFLVLFLSAPFAHVGTVFVPMGFLHQKEGAIQIMVRSFVR